MQQELLFAVNRKLKDHRDLPQDLDSSACANPLKDAGTPTLEGVHKRSNRGLP